MAKQIAVLDNSLKIFLVDDDPAYRCLLEHAVRHYGCPDTLRAIKRFGSDIYVGRGQHLRRKAPSERGVAALFSTLLIVTLFFL
jgi:hypothetical protein